VFAEVEALVAELLRAAGRRPRDVPRSKGANADEKVHI
jgi:hypothetical protein